MTAVESTHELSKDAPDEILFSHLVVCFHDLDLSSKVALLAILHVDVEIRGGFYMFPLIVSDDVAMTEAFEDGELGLELLALFWLHELV